MEASNISTYLYFSELGDGWAVAVLDTQDESNFIKEGQKSCKNSAPYWISGSTNFYNAEINYTDYIANNSGTQPSNVVWHFVFH